MHAHYKTRWNAARSHALAQGMEIVESGWEQHVILDHKRGVVYRYPRHESADAKLADEVAILGYLNQRQFSTAIPTLLKHYTYHSAYRIIEGKPLSPELLAQLPDSAISAIGHALGVFLAELHAADPAIIHGRKSQQTMSLITYYSGRINRSTPPKSVKHAATIALEQLRTFQQQSRAPLVLVHGDLHGLNIIVDPDTMRLAGVIDFSEAEIGDPHQDLRKLFMTDARLLDPALQSYAHQGGRTLNREHIITWAIVNEWSNACHFWHKKHNLTYQRALANLKQWGVAV